jgi:GT2 family glycosyltransferase
MRVSAIVGTRNRAHAIADCLSSIAAALAKAAPLDAEIIVVDNGSTDRTSVVIQNWAASCAFPVRLLFEPRPGLSAARNYAMRVAKGGLLVFTDDDCRLSKDYINDLLRRDAADNDLVLRGGRVELGDPTDLTLSIKTSPDLMRWHRRMNSAKYENLAATIVGCNMALRREVAERIGPFDERFGPGASVPASEDTDWIYRAYLANITIEYVPDMVIYHHHGRKRQSEGDKLCANYAIGNGGLYAKYLFKDPNLCRTFVRDVKISIGRFLSGRRNYFVIGNFGCYRHVWLAYCVLGAVKFLFLVVTGGMKNSFVRPDRKGASLGKRALKNTDPG